MTTTEMTFERWILVVQTIAQLGTFGFLVWYAVETFWIRKNASKQTEAVAAQLSVMQKTRQRQVMRDEASDEPRLLWLKDWQRAGFMWKVENTGGPAKFLEARSSHGRMHVVRPFLAAGESCSVIHDFSESPDERDADIEYFGLKYESSLGRAAKRVYRYTRESRLLEEVADVSYSSLKNVGTVGE